MDILSHISLKFSSLISFLCKTGSKKLYSEIIFQSNICVCFLLVLVSF